MSADSTFVGFGDLMMSLKAPGKQKLVQASNYEVRFTGAEANVAAMLSGLGVRASVASKVPESDVGQACVNFLRQFGIETEHIARGGERLGLLFVEAGASQRPSVVTYDRLHSAFSESQATDYDWPLILKGASWLHFSGTAPALGASVRAVLMEGLQAAHDAGVTVSCDLNYRARLWSPEEARETMEKLAPFIDVLFGNEEDAAQVFGIRAEGSDVTAGTLSHDSYRMVAERLVERWGFKVVATSLRGSVSASINRWAGMMFDGDQHYVSRTYEINPVVDRVGGGDSFAGGIIYGLLNKYDGRDCVDFAAAASCLKHTIPGDFNLVNLEDIRALVGGDESGRVRR